jgi:hypothetical protein
MQPSGFGMAGVDGWCSAPVQLAMPMQKFLGGGFLGGGVAPALTWRKPGMSRVT